VPLAKVDHILGGNSGKDEFVEEKNTGQGGHVGRFSAVEYHLPPITVRFPEGIKAPVNKPQERTTLRDTCK